VTLSTATSTTTSTTLAVVGVITASFVIEIPVTSSRREMMERLESTTAQRFTQVVRAESARFRAKDLEAEAEEEEAGLPRKPRKPKWHVVRALEVDVEGLTKRAELSDDQFSGHVEPYAPAASPAATGGNSATAAPPAWPPAQGQVATVGGNSTTAAVAGADTKVELISFSFTVENVNYAAIYSSSGTFPIFKEKLKDAVCTLTGHLSPSDIDATLGEGSVYAQISIRTPSSASSGQLMATLIDSETVATQILREVHEVPGLANFTSGTVWVDRVTKPVLQELTQKQADEVRAEATDQEVEPATPAPPSVLRSLLPSWAR